MIPLSDVDRRPLSFPIVTAGIILLNFIVFLVELSQGDAFVERWSLVPYNVTHGTALATVLTAMFLHGSWLHIISNMVFLWAFGPEIEDAMGKGRYLAFYLLAGLVAMVVQVAAIPFSHVPNLGASGAIAGVMGVFLVTYPHDRIRTLLFIFVFVTITYIPAAVLVGLWFLLQLFSAAGSMVSNQSVSGGVAYMAHIGGFLFGAFLGRLFERRNGSNDSMITGFIPHL